MTATTHLPTTKQLTLLKIIYKFRFVTPDLIAHYRHTSTSAANASLAILLKNGYIARLYDSSYRLHGKAARYYLAPKSLKFLKQQAGFNERVLQARDRDAQAPEPFVSSALEAFNTALTIRSSYPDQFMIFSKYELANYPQFPRPLPTLYLKRNEQSLDRPHEYLIELLGESPFWVVKKLIDRYLEQDAEGTWPGGTLPPVILLTHTPNLHKRVAGYLAELTDHGYLDEDTPCLRVVTDMTSLK